MEKIIALTKADETIIDEIIEFAKQRYGHDKIFQQLCNALDKQELAAFFFQEFVNWEDEVRHAINV